MMGRRFIGVPGGAREKKMLKHEIETIKRFSSRRRDRVDNIEYPIRVNARIRLAGIMTFSGEGNLSSSQRQNLHRMMIV